jgi:hypothetical protein
MHKLLITLLVLGNLGCAAPRKAIEAQARLTATAEVTAEQTQTETQKLVSFAIEVQTQRALAEQTAAYEKALALSTHFEGEERDKYVARVTAAYLQGMTATKDSAKKEADRLGVVAEKVGALGRAVTALNGMANSEADLSKADVKDFMGAIESLAPLIEQLANQNTSKVLTGPAPQVTKAASEATPTPEVTP